MFTPSLRLAPWLLALLVFCVLLPGTATLPLLDRDEPRFVTAAREMAERGDWIKPTFNGRDRFDKPALSYWLMCAGTAVFGQNELGARFPGVLCALVLVLAVWRIGCLWFSPAAGWLAALGLATCLQLFIHGRLALADISMLLAVGATQFALAALLFPKGILDAPAPRAPSSPALAATPASPASAPASAFPPPSRAAWWTLWVSVGLGFLAKGPIALAVPLVTLLLFRFAFWRQPLPWRRLGAGRGMLLALLVIAAWGIPALLVTEGRFFAVGIGEHVVQRGYEKFNGRTYNPFFYLFTAPLSLFPWVFFAPLAWQVARTREVRRRWLVSWFVAPYLIFTAYATQLPHYVLPAFPAFFLLLGEGLAGTAGRWRRLGENLLLGIALLLIGLFVLVFTRSLPPEAEALRLGFGGAFVALLGLGLLAHFALAGGRAARFGLVAGVFFVTLGALFLSVGLRRTSLSVRLPDHWRNASAETTCVGLGYVEPSLVYYSKRQWKFELPPEELQKTLAGTGPVVVVRLERQIDPLHLFTGLDKWKTVTAPLPEELKQPGWTRQTLVGFNPGRTRWQELSIWHRP